jgi:hypothetical protein
MTNAETILVVIAVLLILSRLLRPKVTPIDGTVPVEGRPVIQQETPIPKPEIGSVPIHGNANCIMDLKACNCLAPESPTHIPEESNVVSLDAWRKRRSERIETRRNGIPLSV